MLDTAAMTVTLACDVALDSARDPDIEPAVEWTLRRHR